MLFDPREEGQGIVEYAFLLLLVGLATLVVLILLGPGIGNAYSGIVGSL